MIDESSSPLQNVMPKFLANLKPSIMLPDNIETGHSDGTFDIFYHLAVAIPETFTSVIGTCLQIQDALQLRKRHNNLNVPFKVVAGIHRNIGKLLHRFSSNTACPEFCDYVNEILQRREKEAPILSQSSSLCGSGSLAGSGSFTSSSSIICPSSLAHSGSLARSGSLIQAAESRGINGKDGAGGVRCAVSDGFPFSQMSIVDVV